MYRWNGNEQFPCVITVFSAPNYCDAYKNKGAVIKFSDNTLNIQQFVYTAHPYLLPNFMDLFTWSIPFLSEKVSEMFYTILNAKPKKASPEKKIDEEAKKAMSTPSKAEILRKKVNSISKMIRMFKVLRQENEDILKLKGLCTDSKLPRGILLQGSSAIKDALQQFTSVKSADKINEARPLFK